MVSRQFIVYQNAPKLFDSKATTESSHHIAYASETNFLFFFFSPYLLPISMVVGDAVNHKNIVAIKHFQCKTSNSIEFSFQFLLPLPLLLCYKRKLCCDVVRAVWFVSNLPCCSLPSQKEYLKIKMIKKRKKGKK